MGRISKRKAAVKSATAITRPKQIMNVGIYARLSSDTDKKKNESIDVQVDIAKSFIEYFNRHNMEHMEIFDIYQDLGKTGTNFKRDEFTRLMQDIKLHDVNCVIVKDLSRFGRNYLQAGNYIEKIFPFLNVRFIAVADGIDTGTTSNQTKNMAMEIKNLVNDLYAKDFSAKARIHLKQRREEGSYVGGPSPYGYDCVWKNKIRILVPDKNTASIVKFVFAFMIEKKSYTAVLREINKRRINPPLIYKKTKQVYCSKNEPYYGWDKSGIQRILKNPVYKGNLEQGKTSYTGRDEVNRIHKNADEWVVIENAHEPIVSLEDFNTAQQIVRDIFEKNKNKNHLAVLLPREENIFDQILYCGVCGKKMTRHSMIKKYADGHIERVESYSCLSSNNGKVDNCNETNRITKRALALILVKMFHLQFSVFLEDPQKYSELGRNVVEQAGTKYDENIRKLQIKLERIHEAESNTYMEYRLGDLKRSDYLELKLRNVDIKDKISNQIEEMKISKSNLSKESDKFSIVIRELLKMKSGKVLTKDLLGDLVKRINVYPGKRIEIEYCFLDEFLKGMKIA